MKITEVATNVISIWEHGGQYTCHGNGAYGLIGFQWGNVTQLLKDYQAAGGKLQQPVDWYADALVKQGQIDELNQLAHTPLMQHIQHVAAHKYMERAIKLQQKYYNFQLPLSQLILCDMGVNNGIWNKYVQDVKEHNSEFDVIWGAQQVRIGAMKSHGIWDKYAGIRRRYNYYLGLCKSNHHLTMKKFHPVLEVNGYNVNIGEYPIEVI